jgi:hypothetical protein
MADAGIKAAASAAHKRNHLDIAGMLSSLAALNGSERLL